MTSNRWLVFYLRKCPLFIFSLLFFILTVDKFTQETCCEHDAAAGRDVLIQITMPAGQINDRSGFMETTLDEVLNERGIRRFVACGLSSYGCVEATVLYGKLYGYDVAVAANAIAGTHSEEFPTTKGIPIFLNAWKKAGIEILEPEDDPFGTQRTPK